MRAVVDTNVWGVANGGHSHAPVQCRDSCVAALEDLAAGGVLAVDERFEILGQYYGELPQDSFSYRLLNLLQRQAGKVEYRPCSRDENGSIVVPPCLHGLHRKDWKFAAVSLTYDPPAPVLNAVDTDWQQCAEGCAKAGIPVRELCLPHA